MRPAARQRVLVEGRAGLYFVLTVYESGTADLVNLNSATLVEGVQFDKILPLPFPEIEVDDPQSGPNLTN